jgi:DNA (cytosine-5)-methyltransferase 1
MAVQQVLGGHLAWVADPDPGAAAILAHHYPDVPNLGDITAANWATVQPVDILCGGYPCQPFSVAGRRKGTKDERHIWPYIARALGVLRPRLAVFENVRGHLRLGFDVVLCALARIGFDAEWVVVPASEVGAPHRRDRLFVLAWPADAKGPRLEGLGLPGWAAECGPGPAADAADLGHERAGGAWDRWPGPADRREPVADAAGVGDQDRAVGNHRVQLLAEPRTGGGDRTGARPAGAGRDHPAAVMDWGKYGPAVGRWEVILGRPAPWPAHPDGGLNPAFEEWMHGLPAGHVTNPAIWEGWRPKTAQNAQLRALGNGVVPQQGAAALRLLLDRAALNLTAA